MMGGRRGVSQMRRPPVTQDHSQALSVEASVGVRGGVRRGPGAPLRGDQQMLPLFHTQMSDACKEPHLPVTSDPSRLPTSDLKVRSSDYRQV